MTPPRAFRTHQRREMESSIFTPFIAQVHIIHILSLALDSLLDPSSSVLPQSSGSSLRFRAIACVILVTNSFFLILVLKVCILRSHSHNVEFLPTCSSPPLLPFLFFNLEHHHLPSFQIPVLYRCTYHLPAGNVPNNRHASRYHKIRTAHCVSAESA